MIRDRDQFQRVARKLSLAYAKIAATDNVPTTDDMLTLSDAADDMLAFVSSVNRAIQIIALSQQSAAVIRLSDFRGKP